MCVSVTECGGSVLLGAIVQLFCLFSSVGALSYDFVSLHIIHI